MPLRACAVVFAFCFVVAGCSEYPSGGSRSPEHAARFILQNAQRTLPDGSISTLVLRMNIDTGETFTLSGNPPRWESLADDLQVRYSRNPRTNKLERADSLPDGTDLSALSKEDLIRRLNASLRACGTTPVDDPNDPLGIRR